MVHLIDPIGGGLRQSIQERCGYDHVLASPGKGWTWHTFMVDGGDDGSSPSSDFGEGDGGGSPTAQCRSIRCGPTLAAPPSKLAIECGGAPFLAGVLRSTP
jgi:hypothetical protein